MDVWKIGIYLEFQFHLVSKEKKKMDYIEKLWLWYLTSDFSFLFPLKFFSFEKY